MRSLILISVLSASLLAACSPEEQIPTLAPTAEQISDEEIESTDQQSERNLPPTNTPSTSQLVETPIQNQNIQPSPLPQMTSAPPVNPTSNFGQDAVVNGQIDGGTGPIGVIQVDQWLFDILDVRVDPGIDASTISIILLGNATNNGTQNEGFMPYGLFMLQSHSGREYQYEGTASFAAWEKYGTDLGVSMNPGTSQYVAAAFPVLSSETSFTIVPDSLATSWGGNIDFSLSDIDTGVTDLPVPSESAIGVIRVNHWLFEINEVHSDPGMDSSRQTVVLVGYVTNEGLENDRFSPINRLLLQDVSGRFYEYDQQMSSAARDRYGADNPRLNPGARGYVAYAFDTPVSEKLFTIVPDSRASSWSGNVTFTVP